MPFHDAVAARRRQLSLTLQQLAERSGVSAAMLSQVERGRKSPTLRMAARIAAGLDCAVSELLADEPPSEVTVRRRRERRVFRDHRSGIERQSLAPSLLAHGVEVVWYLVPARRASGMFPAQGRGMMGHLTVVRGTLECRGPGDPILLRAGDSLDYPGTISHRFRNPGSGTCEFILVIVGSRPARPTGA